MTTLNAMDGTFKNTLLDCNNYCNPQAATSASNADRNIYTCIRVAYEIFATKMIDHVGTTLQTNFFAPSDN
jgi:hypothetical protein